MTEYHRYSALLERVQEAQSSETITGELYSLLADLRDALNDSERRNKKLTQEANAALWTAEEAWAENADLSEAVQNEAHKAAVYAEKVDRQIKALKRQDQQILDLRLEIENALVQIARTEESEELHSGVVAAREHLRKALRWNAVEPVEPKDELEAYALAYKDFSQTDAHWQELAEDFALWGDYRGEALQKLVHLEVALTNCTVRVTGGERFKGLQGKIVGFSGAQARVEMDIPEARSSAKPIMSFPAEALELEGITT